MAALTDHQQGAATALIVSSGAAAAGAALDGFRGAMLGLTVAGGVQNAWRAGRDWSHQDAGIRREAGKAGMLALIELGLAGYLVYQGSVEKKR